jgi:hypothetical protein
MVDSESAALLRDFIATDVRTVERRLELLEALHGDEPRRFAGNAYLITISAGGAELETLTDPHHAASVSASELHHALTTHAT